LWCLYDAFNHMSSQEYGIMVANYLLGIINVWIVWRHYKIFLCECRELKRINKEQKNRRDFIDKYMK